MASTSEKRFDPLHATQLLLEIARERSLKAVLRKVVEYAVERTEFVIAQVWLIQEGDRCESCRFRPECADRSRCLHLVEGKGLASSNPCKAPPPYEDLSARVPLNLGPMGEAVASGELTLFGSPDRPPTVFAGLEWIREEGVRECGLRPIEFGGEVLGVLAGFAREHLPETVTVWGRIFADHIGAAITNARAFEEIRVAEQRLEQANQRLERELAERNEMAEKLRESERKYRELVEYANSIILRWNRDGRITFLNEYGQRFFGYSSEEILGRPIMETIVPVTESGGRDLSQLMKRICSNPEAFEQNTNENVRRNGERVWITWANRIVRNEDGQITEILSVGSDITETKIAQTALRERTRQLELALEVARMGVWQYDLSTDRFTPVQGGGPVSGLTAELFPRTAEAFHALVHPGDRQRVIEAREQVLKNETCQIEYRILLPDENIRWVFASWRCYCDANGQPSFLIGVDHDVTDRRRMEEELRLMHFSLEHASDAVYWMNTQGRVVFANQAACRSLGRTQAELLTLGITDIDPAFPAASWGDAWDQLKAKGSETFQTWHRTKDGQVFPVEVTSNYVAFGGKEYAFAFARNIAERKLAEEALRRSETYLAEGQRLSRTGSWAWSPVTFQILYWSEEMFRIFGLDPRQGVPASETFIQRVHPEDRDHVTEYLQNMARQASEYEHDHRIVLPDGTVKHLHATGHPVLDETGRLVEYVGTAMDVTEQKRVEEELRKHREHLEELVKKRTEELAEATARAEAANRSKSAFLANMSHELRTPLNAVLGFSRLLKRGSDVTPRQQEALEIVIRSGEHLLALINNVLDMAKIESGSVALEESEIDLAQLLHEIQSLMGVMAVEKGLHFALERAPDLPRYVAVDARKLRQVLLNLVGNAIKYTESGRVRLQAMLTCLLRLDRSQVRFEVEDSGPGIGTEDCQRIFMPFVQLGDQAPAQAGTGLGLAICKQYVDLMGGQIGVASQPGKGSVFHFTIPVRVLPAVAEPEAPEHGRIIALAGGQPCYRLLIVEDQPENRLLLRRLLDPLGFELKEAVNGKEAVALYEQWHPDLIWMDIRMPVMDGLAAIRQIRTTETGAQTKIIALTAHALEEERQAIMAAGCDDFVRKPFREQEIFDILARHLQLKFVHESNPCQDSASETPEFALRPEHWKALPADIAHDLRQAVLELDTIRTLALVNKVSELNAPLGRALKKMVTQLDYEGLTKWLEREHS